MEENITHNEESKKVTEKEQRKEKLNILREKGINPYPNSYDVTDKAIDIQECADKYIEDAHVVSVAGRIMLFRVMGKSTFLTIKDTTSTIQLYLQKDMLGDDFYNDVVKRLIDTGDIVGAKGKIFKTKTGEVSVHVSSFTLLSKALNPLPEKFHGLTDIEARYRQRYLDLIINDNVKEDFLMRSKIITTVRNIMEENAFIEVETPMMHPILGGAKARPFTTHHNTLDMPLYLRIAPELYLKRLIIGGFDKVFELNRNFRNEGVSSKHNPEFTMLEAYMAYKNFDSVMELVEDMFYQTSMKIFGKDSIEYQGDTLSFQKPFRRISMVDIVAEHTKLDFNTIATDDEAIEMAKSIGVHVDTKFGKPSKWETMVLVFEEKVEEHLLQPTFVTNYPSAISPLSKPYADNPDIAERYELFIASMEISNGFSELNDPIDQKNKFEIQVEAGKKGDNEAMQMDNDYINALEYGLPPTGGFGLGIDRMVMLFLNTKSIRDTLLFPHMKSIK